jgi:hypothetical protein
MSEDADSILKAQRRKEQANARNRRYNAKNKERIAAKRLLNLEENRAKNRAIYHKKKEYYLAQRKEYYAENREKIIAYVGEYQKRNWGEVSTKRRAWFVEKMKDPEYATARRKSVVSSVMKRYRSDASHRMVLSLRNRVRGLLRTIDRTKRERTMELIGCTPSELINRLEAQFEPWMSWENYGFGRGKWVVDHIVPCRKFDLTRVDEQRKCFHFSNLRPLCWKENHEKSDWLDEGVRARHL